MGEEKNKEERERLTEKNLWDSGRRKKKAEDENKTNKGERRGRKREKKEECLSDNSLTHTQTYSIPLSVFV